ncbi:MAG: protease pro-enzyme activation domain-containing protein [Thermoplasmata archaeon]
MGLRAAFSIALAVLAMTAAIPSLAHSAPVGTAPRPADPAPLLTDQAPVPAGGATSPLPGAALLPITLTLRLSNQSRLSLLLADLENPRSSQYRAFISTAEFRSEFAPSPREIQSLEWAVRAAGGRSVGSTPGRLGIETMISVRSLDALLGVKIVSYLAADDRRAYTAVGTPHLPAGFGDLVAGVGGLSNAGNAVLRLAATEIRPAPVDQFVDENGTGVQWAVGSDYARAYGASALWTGANVSGATYPSQTAIATLLASSYNSIRQVTLPPYDPKVLNDYFNYTLGPSWPHPHITGVPVAVPDASLPPLPMSLGALNDTTQDEYENSLDLEMAGSMAPGAALYNFYFNGSLMVNPAETVGALADDFALDLGAALDYNYAPQRLAVVSGSFGLPDQNDSLWDSELEEAAALGVTIVCASGDQGNAPGSLTGRGSALPEWPATAAFTDSGSVSVGGVTLTMTGSPSSNGSSRYILPAFDPHVTGISSAVAWYEHSTPGEYAGSEGGVSPVFPEPAWQFHSAAQYPILNATEHQGASSLGRAGPDVAFPGNNTIAFVFANSTGTVYLDVLGGTSVAAPVLAGLLGDLVAVRSAASGSFSPLGYLDPALYQIASFYASAAVRNSSEEATDPFEDIVHGSNFLFSAAPGWDAVTGWGGFTAIPFLTAYENSTISRYVYTGPTPTLPPRAPAPFLTPSTEYLLIGIAALVAIALVILAARPPRGAPMQRPPPMARASEDPFATAAAPGTASGAMFSCPYCGGERPSEPVRCPHCGML